MKLLTNKNITIFGLLFLMLPVTISAQKKPASFNTYLKGIYNIKPNKISLRFNISDANRMQYFAETGVVIDRLVLDATKKESKNWERLTANPIKPYSKEQLLKGIAARDTGMAVIHKCLYEKTDFPKVSFIENMQNQNMDVQNRYYLMALYASRNPSTAIAAGLGYDDFLTVDSTKSYVYRISMAGDDKTIAAAFVYVYGKVLNDKKIFQGLRAQGNDKSITLNWEADLSDDYNGYWIERSKSNGAFERVNKVMYVSNYDSISNKKSFTDSVANYTNYTYRVIALNSFGESFTSNITEKTMAKDLTAPEETFLKAELKNDIIKLNWRKPSNKDLSGYYIMYGKKINGTDSLVTKDFINANTLEYSFKKPANFKAAYFRIMALDTAKNYSFSNSAYVFVVDNTPPKPPIGLTGVINEKGIATLSWSLDSTDAIMGYKVFFANQDDHDFTAVSGIIESIKYFDTVQLKTLSPYIYYKVVAIDQNYNHSNFSQVLKLKRPDKIPPTEPVILDYKVSNTLIFFNWTPIKAEDLLHYKVMRRAAGEKNWTLLATTKNVNYIDSMAGESKEWEYSIIAVDESNLESTPSFPLAVKNGYKLKTDNLKPIKVILNKEKNEVLLQWKKSNYVVARTIIYKKVNNDFISLTSVNANETQYKIPVKDVEYKYAIKLLYADGKESDLFYE